MSDEVKLNDGVEIGDGFKAKIRVDIKNPIYIMISRCRGNHGVHGKPHNQQECIIM